MKNGQLTGPSRTTFWWSVLEQRRRRQGLAGGRGIGHTCAGWHLLSQNAAVPCQETSVEWVVISICRIISSGSCLAKVLLQAAVESEKDAFTALWDSCCCCGYQVSHSVNSCYHIKHLAGAPGQVTYRFTVLFIYS